MQMFVRNADTRHAAVELAEPGIQKEAAAVLENDVAVTESSNTDLRPLQISHDADIASAFPSRLANPFRPGALLRFIAMRKIQPCDIHSRTDHFPQSRRIVRSRSERCNNFGSSQHGADYCTQP